MTFPRNPGHRLRAGVSAAGMLLAILICFSCNIGEDGGPADSGKHDSDATVTKDGLSLSLLPRDTLITIGDSVVFTAEARNEKGTVDGADWDFDGDGKIDFTSDPATMTEGHLAVGFRYPAAGTYHPVLTVKGSGGATLEQRATVRVAQDLPFADAGPDQNAVTDAEIALAGRGGDSLGSIVKQEWRVGSAAYRNAPDGKFTYPTPSVAGDVMAIFRVTDDDGQTAQDTAIIHVTAPSDSVQDALTLVLATKDTLISIGDSAAYIAAAKNGQGRLVKAAWDLDGDGEIDSAVDLKRPSDTLTAGFRFAKTGTYHPSLAVTGAKGGTLKVTLTVQVELDPPMADAGSDFTAPPDTTLILAGKGKDGLGKIVKREWSLVGGAFLPTADGKISYKTPSTAGDIPAVFRVTDDDGLIAVDTLVIHVVGAGIGTVAPALAGLAATDCAFVPAFHPDSLSYACSVPSAAATVALTASLADSDATLSINSLPAASGAASAPIDLGTGAKVIPIMVTARNGQKRTYVLTVAHLSGNADLKSLALSAGTLSPAFAPGTLSYVDSVGETSVGIGLTAAPEDSANAAMTLNGVPLAAHTAAAIPLAQKETLVNLVVKAEDPAVAKTYVIKIIKYDHVSLAAPTVALGAYLAPDQPTWVWTPGGGGNGNFRYRLDNPDLSEGAIATNDLVFSPAADLAAGMHTLFVQEQDASGTWSPPGQATVNLGGLKGVADYPLLGHAADTLGLNGDVIKTQAPYLAQGVYLNGSYSGAGVPNPGDAVTPTLTDFDTTAFTAEVDFKPDGLPFAGEPVLVGGRTEGWLGGSLDADGRISLVYNGNLSVKGTSRCSAGEWHALKLEYAGGTAKVYLDGMVSATLAVALKFGDAGRDFNFGSANAGMGAFKGNWRNLRISAGATRIAQYPLFVDNRDITGRQSAILLTNAQFQPPMPGATLAGGFNLNDISTPSLSGLDLTDFRIAAEFSIAAWPASVKGMPIFMGGSVSHWIGARIEADGTLTLICNNTVSKTTTTVVSPSLKHSVAVRFSAASGVASVYLDGVLAGTQAAAALISSGDKNVSTTNSANGTAFKGTLYRIRVDGK